MKLLLNIPSDLELLVKMRAVEAGIDLQAYVLRALKIAEEDSTSSKPVSDEQFAASLERLKAVHASANPNFDDSRESIYDGRGE